MPVGVSARFTAVFVPPMSTPTSIPAPHVFRCNSLLFQGVYLDNLARLGIHPERLDLVGFERPCPHRMRKTQIHASPRTDPSCLICTNNRAVAILGLFDRRDHNVLRVDFKEAGGARSRAGMNTLVDDWNLGHKLFGRA